jgi:hypothetical protein
LQRRITVASDLDALYIPENDRELRRVQRQVDELDKEVRDWALKVVNVLPSGLPTNADETYVLSLFLAQQRRRNILLDAFEPQPATLWTTLRNSIGIAARAPDREVLEAVHRQVAARIDSDIERSGAFFCSDNKIPPESEPAIDWRVAIRFMSQSIYSRVANVDLSRIANHPRRFELALVARELATEVADKRRQMFASFGLAA